MKYLLLFLCSIGLANCANKQGLADVNIVVDTEDMRLDRNYKGTHFTVKNGMTLDLNGFTVNGKNHKGEVFSPILLIQSHVKNGKVKYADNCINVLSHITPDDIKQLTDLSWQEAIVYAINNILPNSYTGNSIRGVQCSKSNRGVYVYPFVKNTDISFNTFRNLNKMAIYLDSGTRHATITGNHISDTGMEFTYFGREAISVDASSDNLIYKNTFKDTWGSSAISIYQNCGEKGVARPMGARNNRIEQNTFEGAWIGIHNSSRAKKRGAGFHTCRPDMPDKEQVSGTIITGNKFKNVFKRIKDNAL